MPRFAIPVITGIVLILGGIAHGLRSDRWGFHPDVLAAAEKLSKVPATIGNWHSEEATIDQRVLTLAGAQGYLSRRYISRDDGRTVHVTILCGRHGPISVHPPTACFVGAGWNLNDTPVKYSIQTGEPPQNKAFWLADFSRTFVNITHTKRTFWSWSVSGDWEAAAHPRLKFATSPFLYKIYITYNLTDAGDPVDKPTETFIKRLLSEIDRNIFESGEDL